MDKSSQSIETTIKNRIYGHGKGWCFTIDHFSDLKSREAVKKALQRLTQAGTIRRLAKGLYDYPRQSKELGVLPPPIDNIAKAISEKDHVRIQATGAYASNLIGLSDQVPAKVVFLTEGSPKTIKIGKMEIEFRRTTPRNVAMTGTHAGLILQALRYIGKKQIDSKMEKNIKKRLESLDPKELKKAYTYAPAWIKEYFNQLLKSPL